MMKVLAEQPAIVARAHSEIESLAAALTAKRAEQKDHEDRAYTAGLEIGRMICEYAGRAEIVARLVAENASKKNGGRPKAAHCFVAELAQRAGAKVTIRHMERCARAWMRAQKKGLPIGTPLRAVEAPKIIATIVEVEEDSQSLDPGRLFKPLPEAPADDPFDIANAASHVAANIARSLRTIFYTDAGYPRLRTKTQKDKAMQIINRQLEEEVDAAGIDWEVSLEPKSQGA